MAIWHTEVTPGAISELFGRCRGYCQHHWDPDSEEWMLYMDIQIAEKRCGRNRAAVARVLLAGREDWGIGKR